MYSINPEDFVQKMLSFVNRKGQSINLTNPRTIQDKLCWLNIYDTDSLKTKCADKILIHDYCKEIIGEDICVPIIATYDNPEQINWNELPQRFVIKCNHGSGYNIIVKDKSTLNTADAEHRLSGWLIEDFAQRNGYEAHYHDIIHKIIVEEFIDDNGKVPTDYKFCCFNGEPKFLQVIGDRFGSRKHLNYYDLDFNQIKTLERTDFRADYSITDKRPEHFDKMIEYATKLSSRFKFVRVDFYEVNGRVYLGELTFTPGAMLFRYRNREDEIRIGDMLDINKESPGTSPLKAENVLEAFSRQT